MCKSFRRTSVYWSPRNWLKLGLDKKTQMIAHRDINKNTQKYTPNPTMCLESHQGTCCQSDHYVRLGEWKQSRSSTQYGTETGTYFSWAAVNVCVVFVWMRRIMPTRDQPLFSPSAFLEGLWVERVSGSITKHHRVAYEYIYVYTSCMSLENNTE